MDIKDILSLEILRDLEVRLSKQFNVNASILDVEGERIFKDANWINKLCPAIKDTKGQTFICAVAHLNLENMVGTSKKAHIEECDAGLLKMLAPLLVNGEWVGLVSACGALLDDGEIDPFLINKTSELPEETIEALSQGIPRVSTDTVHAFIDAVNKELKELTGGKIDPIEVAPLFF